MNRNEKIYLIDMGDEITWCDEPDPSGNVEPEDVTAYIRVDIFNRDIKDQQATIVKLVEALDAVCDLALMPDHECPDDIQPVVSGYKDLINSVKDKRVKEGDCE